MPWTDKEVPQIISLVIKTEGFVSQKPVKFYKIMKQSDHSPYC